MIGTLSAFTAVVVFSIVLSSANGSCSRKSGSQDNLQKLGLANNELAFNLYQQFIAQNKENIFFSPFSISTVFAMLFDGARDQTEEELRKVLGYDKADLSSNNVDDTFHQFLTEALNSGDANNGYVLSSANAIFADKDLDINPDYKKEVEDSFEGSVQEVDFVNDEQEVVNDINSFVSEKTNGKIQKLLDQLSPSTVLFLLNAVYFKGTWKIQFDKKKTTQGNFYNYGLESEAKEVPLMHLTEHFPLASMEDFQALELPYKGDNVSMYVVLPYENDGLAAVEESLTPEKFAEIQKNVHTTKVDITLPKFKLDFSRELSSDFKALGAEDIFDPSKADFSGITESKEISVSQVIHKAVVEVNEEGSEAAAVTGIGVTSLAVGPGFTADHPFLFAIVEKGTKSNTILFLGRVNKL